MASKKKNKKEIKDSVDINDIIILKEQENKKDEDQIEVKNKDKSFSFSDFLNDKRIPIYSYCRKLFKYDLKNMKEKPEGISEDSTFIKGATNKKRFITKLIYLISMLIIAFTLLTISILLLLGSIGSFDPSVASNTYLPGVLMALSLVVLLFFI